VLPEGVNVSQLKAKSDKHRLIITAPVRTQAKEISKGLRTIPIQRKLRQRKGVKAVSPERKKISAGVEKKKQLPVTPTQKKKQLSTTTGAEKKKTIPSIPSKPSGTKLSEQGKITSKKGISSEKKPISTEQMSPISTEKKSKKKSTSTSTQEGQKGSDILKKVFGTEQGTEKSSTSVGTQGTKKESSPQRQGQTSVGQVLSGFQSSPSDVRSGSSSEGQQQK